MHQSPITVLLHFVILERLNRVGQTRLHASARTRRAKNQLSDNQNLSSCWVIVLMPIFLKQTPAPSLRREDT